MTKLFVLNTSPKNAGININGGETLNLVNEGLDGAVSTVDNNGVLTTSMCLAPFTDVSIPPSTGGEIELDGVFVVQVDGAVIPHYFTAEQLAEYFDKANTNGAGIAFVTATAPPFVISCVDATKTATTGGVWGLWEIEVNGILYNVNSADFTNLITLDNTAETSWKWLNNTAEDLRVRIFNATNLNPMDSGWSEAPVNPTTNFTDSEITFCLAANNDRYIISCTPEEGQSEIILNKVRNTLPFLTFNNVAFDIYENGILKVSNVSLLDPQIDSLINIAINRLDGETGRHISITNKTSENIAVELFEGSQSFIDDTNIELGNVEPTTTSFHFCLAGSNS